MNNIVTGNIFSIDNIDATLSPKEQIQGNLTIITETVIGTVSPLIKTKAKIDSKKTITGKVTYGNGTGEYVPVYDGDYEIVPVAFQDITLPTKDKKMMGDVVVKEVPYYETSNLSGGVTVYIAGKVETI